ncbi:hypothetical protein B566_EDAN014775 [Ephemera danica]|nr:hypothetical protein B566_EDAN014775 [Ephemera danica]
MYKKLVCRACNATGQQCGVLAGSQAGPGISDADFVFYVSAMETERCHKGLTVAYAAHCQQESVLDRPIAGHANLCPGSISTKRQELDILLSTVKHEILHALGFSMSLYAFFRDTDGRPLSPRVDNGKPALNEKLQTRQWSERVIKTVLRPGWRVRGGMTTRQAHLVVTPRVREEARRHFGCDAIEGAELEDQGEEGTAMTHWEKRLFEKVHKVHKIPYVPLCNLSRPLGTSSTFKATCPFLQKSVATKCLLKAYLRTHRKRQRAFQVVASWIFWVIDDIGITIKLQTILIYYNVNLITRSKQCVNTRFTKLGATLFLNNQNNKLVII